MDGREFISSGKRKLAWGFYTYAQWDYSSIGWIIDTIRYLIAAIKGERIWGNRPRELDDSEELPVIVSSNLMLSNGEICHYCGPATFVKTKNVVVGYAGGSRGTSIRIAKGMSVRVGAQKAAPIRGDVQERTPGILSVTNMRVVFSGNKGAFDKKVLGFISRYPISKWHCISVWRTAVSVRN